MLIATRSVVNLVDMKERNYEHRLRFPRRLFCNLVGINYSPG